MYFGRVQDGSNLFRHSVHPLSFQGQGRRFAPQKLFKLAKLCDDHGVENGVIASVAWQRYAPTDQHVHGYGCRLASKINNKKRQEGKFKERNRHIYCGAYRLTAAAVRALAGAEGLDEIALADVTHHIEDGEIAHTDLRIVFKPGNIDIEGTKTAIVDRLWNACSGPLRFICEYDQDVPSHPSADLAQGPLGDYMDARGRVSRGWDVIRFNFCEWIWKKLGAPD